MTDFNGKIAVVTGGGAGMGRELVRQLAAQGASVAFCDVFEDSMAETKRICEADGLPQGVRITAHRADVSNEDDVLRFRDEVAQQHQTDRIHLLFNNAGIGGGGSFVEAPRAEWERTFNISWFGVYYMCRAFLPLLLKADEGHITNTSSVNGFYAALAPGVSQTAYASAKFAIKGFTEALITDLRNTAPHIKAHIVMPGGIGTPIGANTRKILNNLEDVPLTPKELAGIRARMKAMGTPDADKLTDAQLEAAQAEMMKRFETLAPTSAAQAATIILDGVKEGRWRILVGEDAKRIDRRVRETPEDAYNLDFKAWQPD